MATYILLQAFFLTVKFFWLRRLRSGTWDSLAVVSSLVLACRLSFPVACGVLVPLLLSHYCDPTDRSMQGGFPVLHCLLEFAQAHVHRVGDALQPSHPLSPPSLPALNLSQHQGVFQCIGSLHQVTKVLELQHPSFQ